MDLIPSIVQSVGILLISVGAAMIYPAVGVMVGGAGLLAFGLAWERSR
jgi:hypothetical protein